MKTISDTRTAGWVATLPSGWYELHAADGAVVASVVVEDYRNGPAHLVRRETPKILIVSLE